MLQYIIYYCLVLLAVVKKQQGLVEESENYNKASTNLLKLNNKSSQFIGASTFRTKSSENQRNHKTKWLFII